MNCYKCGAELPGLQVECEYGCDLEDSAAETAAMEKYLREARPVDWTKITTIEDLKTVIQCMYPEMAITPEHPFFETLKPFLKLPPQDKQ